MFVRSRIGSVRTAALAAARWLAPSVVAACTGAAVAGVVEARDAGAYHLAVTTGILAIYAVPIALVASAIARGLVAAWQPRAVIESLIDPDGAAPRLAAWLAVIVLGALTLAWTMFQGTWLLASWTAFKPTTLGFGQPILAVTALALIVVLSRPVARLLAFLARKLDARLPGGGTVFAPRLVIASTIYVAIAAGYLLWEVVVLGRLRAVDTAIATAPAAAIAGTALAHALWLRIGRRVRIVLGIAIVLADALAIGAALHARTADPTLALAIWADEPVARIALARAFDVEAIRRERPLDDLRPDTREPEHPDIVVVVIANTRADRTPAYDGGAPMATLQELARRGAVFERAYAPSNATRRSIPAMLTGIAPHRVVGELTPRALWLDPRHVALAERMRAAGYQTAGFLGGSAYWSLPARTGWSRGFEHVEVGDDDGVLARAAHAWFVALPPRGARRPMFALVYLDEPSRVFDTPRPTAITDDDRRRLYDAALANADARLAHVFAAFANRPPADAPIVLVTSDHGQGLGERGQRVDVQDLYDTHLRVPLVLVGPGIKPQRAEAPVGLVDLTPTVIDLAGYRPPRTGSAMDGRSFADVATGKRTGTPFGIALSVQYDERDPDDSRWAIVRGTWKLIDNGGSYELYDLRIDPLERTNLFGQRAQVVAELKLLLGTRVRAAAVSPFP